MTIIFPQAIAKDGIIPFLAPFEQLSSRGEPVRALGITLTICQGAILIGKRRKHVFFSRRHFIKPHGYRNN